MKTNWRGRPPRRRHPSRWVSGALLLLPPSRSKPLVLWHNPRRTRPPSGPAQEGRPPQCFRWRCSPGHPPHLRNTSPPPVRSGSIRFRHRPRARSSSPSIPAFPPSLRPSRHRRFRCIPPGSPTRPLPTPRVPSTQRRYPRCTHWHPRPPRHTLRRPGWRWRSPAWGPHRRTTTPYSLGYPPPPRPPPIHPTRRNNSVPRPSRSGPARLELRAPTLYRGCTRPHPPRRTRRCRPSNPSPPTLRPPPPWLSRSPKN